MCVTNSTSGSVVYPQGANWKFIAVGELQLSSMHKIHTYSPIKVWDVVIYYSFCGDNLKLFHFLEKDFSCGERATSLLRVIAQRWHINAVSETLGTS
jgi:hypothetical protein